MKNGVKFILPNSSILSLFNEGNEIDIRKKEMELVSNSK